MHLGRSFADLTMQGRISEAIRVRLLRTIFLLSGTITCAICWASGLYKNPGDRSIISFILLHQHRMTLRRAETSFFTRAPMVFMTPDFLQGQD